MAARTVLLLCGVLLTAGGRRVPEWHVRMVQSQGPNTCAVEEIPGTSWKFWSECKYWMPRHICGFQTVIRYECCQGYQMVPGLPGCSVVKPLSDLVDTALELGATRFVDYLARVGLDQRLREPGQGPLTLFVPSNQAFEELSTYRLDALERSLQDLDPPLLLFHLAEGRVSLADSQPDRTVPSLHAGLPLRLTRFSNKVATVNCVRVMRADQRASNGIVHLLAGVMEPPAVSPRPSVPELVLADGRFRTYSRSLMESVTLGSMRADTTYTFFVPSDESFQGLSVEERQRVATLDSVRQEVVTTHIVAQPICATAVTEPHDVVTLGGGTVSLSCNASGVFFGGSRVGSEVLLGSNGIVHIVQDVVVTDRARSLSELIARRPDLTVFASLMGASRLALDNATVFAPSDAAFERLPAATLEALTTGEAARRLLLEHHIVAGRHLRTEALADNLRVSTRRAGDTLRLKVYRHAVGVGTALIEVPNLEAYNGVLHVIDTVLVPSALPVTESLTEEYSMFAEALRRVSEADSDILGDSVTVFAPSNSAFHRWGVTSIDSLLEDMAALRVLVKSHVVGNMLPAGSFSGQYGYRVWTESAQQVTVAWRQEELRVDDAAVVQADIPVAEGVVHCIDSVLLGAAG